MILTKSFRVCVYLSYNMNWSWVVLLDVGVW